MQLSVPRRGGWRAWGAVRADFERALAGAAGPAVAAAEVASELRRGTDYVRVSVAFTVVTTDVADAVAIRGTPSAAPPGMTSPAGRWVRLRRGSSRSCR